MLRREYCGSAAPVEYNALRCPFHDRIYSFVNTENAEEAVRIFRKTEIVTRGTQNSEGWCSCPSFLPGESQVCCAGIMLDGRGFYAYPIRPRGYVDGPQDGCDSPYGFYNDDSTDRHGYAYFRATSIVEAGKEIERQRVAYLASMVPA